MDRGKSSSNDTGACTLRAPDAEVLCLSASGLPHAIELHDASDVASALSTVMPGWQLITVAGHAEPGLPVTIVRSTGAGRYSFQSSWARRPLKRLGLAGAVCGVVADLSQAFLDHRPGTLGLHCGTVRIGGHLVALTGTYRTGKTTLVARLSAEPGLCVFCDDILPIMPEGLTFGLGIQPRLRLPIPESASEHFRTFVERSLTVHDKRYGYIDTAALAPHGTCAPLEAIVVLERQENGSASLHRMEVGEAAGYLIRQNIADPGSAGAYYDQVSAMANQLLCLKLRYSNLEDALEVLLETFGSDSIPAPGVQLQPPLPADLGKKAGESADLSLCYRRTARVALRDIGTDTFLWHMEDRNFYRLNPVAAAVWTLLETPTSGSELASALQQAFPTQDPTEIESDTAELLGVLTSRNLVSAIQ